MEYSGISDTWDLHFQEDSYPLYDRLIQNMIYTCNADPNRVYLLGFSAGGDGVYQILPRMADRFAKSYILEAQFCLCRENKLQRASRHDEEKARE